jgi:hypothetical protein
LHKPVDEPLPADIVSEIAAERARQRDKWGQQDHDPAHWLAILTSELGELGQALVELQLRDNAKWEPYWRSGLIQLAAVAIAATESADRAADATPPGA